MKSKLGSLESLLDICFAGWLKQIILKTLTMNKNRKIKCQWCGIQVGDSNTLTELIMRIRDMQSYLAVSSNNKRHNKKTESLFLY